MAEERRRIIRYALWAAGVLPVAGGLLYCTFWLPYREPAEVPRAVSILPASPPGADDGASLTGYKWVDREAGIVRIPVEDAMATLAGTLPVREIGAKHAEERNQRLVPTDAGSGRSRD